MEGETQSNRDRASEQPYEPEYEKTARKPRDDRPDAFNALAWLLEGATGLFEELRHNDLGLSEEFWVHAYAARRETLLALRAALDELIKRSESQIRLEQERQQRHERRRDIKIDF
jgi:hypothetical protein